MSKVYIAVPNEGMISKHVVNQLLRMAIVYDNDAEKHNLFFDGSSDKPVDANRNGQIKRFLEGDWEWFLTIDGKDNPPVGNPLDYLMLDKDILAFPTPIWYSQITRRAKGEKPIVWNCFDEHTDGGGWREHYPQKGLQPIDAAGTGCMLIHRRVLEHPTMKPAFFREWTDEGLVKTGVRPFVLQAG